MKWTLAFALAATSLAGCSPESLDGSLAAAKSAPAVPEDVAEAQARAGTEAAASYDPTADVAQAKAELVPDVATQGRFGPVFDWPIIPLHLTLLPDGRVLGFGAEPDLSYGTTRYAVWNPAMGTGPESMTELLNQTGTNIFCAGQTLYPATGDVFIAGGTRKLNNQGGNGIAALNLFRYRTSTLQNQAKAMRFRRWYPSVMTTWDGNMLVLGGRDVNAVTGPAPAPATYATTPELFVKGEGWRTLWGAREDVAFGEDWSNWYYPRAFLTPSGKYFLYAFSGQAYVLDPSRKGYIQHLVLRWIGGLPTSEAHLPTIAYAPHRLLSLGDGPNDDTADATTVDLRPALPYPDHTQAPSALRTWGSLTVQADGKVFLNGGSSLYNDLATAFYRSETWDPGTGAWSPGAVAEKARLYHSASILLPDATILTAAGGSPGPQTNPNGEIYYPPYLFKKDGSGDFAARPAIVSSPSTALTWNQPFQVGVSEGTVVSRVTLVHTGGVTHSLNAEQALIDLPFVQDGTTLDLTTPALAVEAPPGYYLLFVFDEHGVPSVARFIRLLDTGSGIPPPRLPQAGVAAVVHDGQSIGFTPELGAKSACYRCQLNIDAPVTANGDGRGAISLQFPDGASGTGVTLRVPGALPVGGWTTLRLSVFPTRASVQFGVDVGTDGGPVAQVIVQDLTPNQWNVLNIPMSRFASASTFDAIRIVPAGTAGSPRFYLDNLRLKP